MKGKRKCDNNVFGDGNWNGDFGAPSKRQQCRRPDEGWYIDADNVFSDMSGSAGGDVVLDFKNSTLRKDQRYSQDHTYECLFRQFGSVATQDNATRGCPWSAAGRYCMDDNSGFGYFGPAYSGSDTYEYLLRRSENVATTGELPIHNLSWEQHFGSTSNSAEPVDAPVVLDFQNSTTVSESTQRGCSMLPVLNNARLLADINASQSTGGNIGCSLPRNPNFVNNNGEDVPHLIGTKRRQDGNKGCFTTSRTVKQRRLTRSVLTSFAGTSNAQVEGVSSCYKDIGDCDCVCEYCGANFWYDERLKGYTRDRKVRYHKCCSGGKVRLRPE
ncbi:hypothetical protein Tco_1424989 [Tanacetum coccineum]